MGFRKYAFALIGALAVLPLSGALAADVKVTGIHNGCPGCTNVLNKTLGEAGATNVKSTPTEVSFSVADAAAADKAAKALFDAGFAGKVEGAKTPEAVGAKGVKSKTIKVAGVHNCCGQCLKGLTEAVKGLGTNDLKAKATTFTITSDTELDAEAVVAALRKAGYNARIEK